MNTPQSADKIYFVRQWTILGLSLLFFGGFIAYNQVQEHKRIDTQERERLVAQTEILEKNLIPQVILVNRLIDGIIKELPSWQAENDGYKRGNRQLSILDAVTVGISPILVIQANGKVIASSNKKLIGMDFSQREYFQTAAKNPDPNILHVSAPFKTVLDTNVISLFRTIPGPSGKFAGIIIVSAVPRYFLTILDSVRYASDMRAAIIHGDGKLFLIAPDNEETTGMNLAIPGTFFTRFRESGKKINVFTGIFCASGENSLVAMRTIQLTTPPMDNALIVGVSRDIEAIFGSWRKNTYIQSLLFAIISLISTLGLFSIQRRRRDQLAEHKKIEDNTEKRFRAYFERSMVGMATTNLGKDWIEVNDALCEVLGYSREELVHMTWAELTYPEDLQPEVVQYGRMLSGEINSYTMDKRFVHKDGHIVYTRLAVRCVLKGDGSADYLVALVEDITERKRAEELLKHERELYMDLITSQPVGIYRIRIFPPETWKNDAWLSSRDAPYAVEMVNDRFCDLLGINKETFIANPGILIDLVHPDDKVDFAKCNEEANVNLSKFKWEGRLIIDRNIHWAHFESLPRVLMNGDVLWTGSLLDITEQKLLEEKLRQSLKMESVGRLAGGVAHDFNNKLTVVLGYAELLKLEIPENPHVLNQLNEIIKAAEHSRDITAQLLTYSRQQIVSPRLINLTMALKDTQRSLPRLIGEDITLSYDLDNDLWNVKIDPIQVDQIIMNLAINARDAMQKGGELKIVAANTTIDKTVCLENTDAKPGDYVLLKFIDTGHGIDSNGLNHIFEPFFTTKDIGKGTGLGLATVYGIVTQNNGFITVDSEPGVGTTFKIHLPRLTDEIRTGAKDVDKPIMGIGTILLVEDDESIRKMATVMLEHIGYTVLTTETPMEAILLCQDIGTRIDLILTDVIMPGMNGKEMVDKIESLRPGIKALFMSGYSSEVISQRGVTEGIVHFIQKPFDMHALNEKIIEILVSV